MEEKEFIKLLKKIDLETKPTKSYCLEYDACQGCFFELKDTWREECILDIIRDWLKVKEAEE